MVNEISINKQFIVGLKKAYDKAVTDKAESFIYDGHDFVTGYAKYFLEYYAPQFGVKL